MSKSLKQHLKQLSEPSSGTPLLTEADILRSIRSNSAPAFKESFWQRHRVALSAGAAALATATVIGIVVLPSSDNVKLANIAENSEATSPYDVAESTQQQPMAVLQGTEDMAFESSAGEGATVSSAPISQPRVLDSRAMQLTAEELSKLKIITTESRITYTEDRFMITIKTNGISTMGPRTATDRKPTPRVVSLYRGGKLLSTWSDETRSGTAVNDLIPVTIRIEDASNAMFPHADVLLWFEPTSAFVNALPLEERSALNKELEKKDPTSLYIERNTASTSIASSGLHPNPVSGETATLQLDVKRSCTADVEIVDINGRSVLTVFTSQQLAEGTHSSLLSPLSSLPNGMYLVVVNINNGQESLVQRLLIER